LPGSEVQGSEFIGSGFRYIENGRGYRVKDFEKKSV
jgi:hypothetical protein